MSQQNYDPNTLGSANSLFDNRTDNSRNGTNDWRAAATFTTTTTSTSTSTSTSTAATFDIADMKKTPNVYLLGGGAVLMLLAVGVFIPLVILFPPAAASIPLVGTLAIPGTGGALVGTVIFPALSGILAFSGLACLVGSVVPRSRSAGHQYDEIPAAAANTGWFAPGWSRVSSLAGGAYGYVTAHLPSFRRDGEDHAHEHDHMHCHEGDDTDPEFI